MSCSSYWWSYKAGKWSTLTSSTCPARGLDGSLSFVTVWFLNLEGLFLIIEENETLQNCSSWECGKAVRLLINSSLHKVSRRNLITHQSSASAQSHALLSRAPLSKTNARRNELFFFYIHFRYVFCSNIGKVIKTCFLDCSLSWNWVYKPSHHQALLYRIVSVKTYIKAHTLQPPSPLRGILWELSLRKSMQPVWWTLQTEFTAEDEAHSDMQGVLTLDSSLEWYMWYLCVHNHAFTHTHSAHGHERRAQPQLSFLGQCLTWYLRRDIS